MTVLLTTSAAPLVMADGVTPFATNPISYNIETDFGAVGDGVTDDTAAFVAFRAAAVNQPDRIDLHFVAGHTYLINGVSGFLALMATGTNVGPFNAVRNCRVYGHGSTIKAGSGPALIWLGGFCMGSRHYLIDSVLAGGTQVHFKNHADAVAFATDINGNPVGGDLYNSWGILTGIEMQASSFPANNYFNDFVFVTDINLSTDIATLSAPIVNSLNDDWPLINFYSTESDGPASIYSVDPRWYQLIEYHDITFERASQNYGDSYSLKFFNCNFPDPEGPFVPSQTKYYYAQGGVQCVGGGEVEFDKVVTNFHYDGVTFNQIAFQSASVDDGLIENCSVVHRINGTPKNITIRNTTADILNFGCAHGVTNSVVLDGVSANSVELFLGTNPIAAFTHIGGGVFSYPIASGPVRWAIPGARCHLLSAALTHIGNSPFTILDIYQSGSDTIIVTDLPGDFPTFTGIIPMARVGVIGAQSIDVSNSTGALELVALSRPAAAGKNVGEYVYYALSGNLFGSAPQQKCFGKFVSVTVTVVTPYTGAQATALLHIFSQYGAQGYSDAHAFMQLDGVINLKIAGTRTWTVSGVTGAQTGDVFPALSGFWFGYHVDPYCGTDMSGDAAGQLPVVTIEIVTDQSSA